MAFIYLFIYLFTFSDCIPIFVINFRKIYHFINYALRYGAMLSIIQTLLCYL
jgi:hypothetical protein